MSIRLLILWLGFMVLATEMNAAICPIEPTRASSSNLDFLTSMLAIGLGLLTALGGLFFFNGLLYANLLFFWGSSLIIILLCASFIFLAWRFGTWSQRPKWWLLTLFFGSIIGLVGGFMTLILGLLSIQPTFMLIGFGLALTATILLIISQKRINKH